MCMHKVKETLQRLQGSTQFLCYSYFLFCFVFFVVLVAKIAKKPRQYVQERNKEETCFLLSVIMCFCVFD